MSHYSEETQNSCKHCNQPFYAERSTKKYCSDSCRQLAYLERRAKLISNAAFIEETAFKIVQEPISDYPESNNVVNEAPAPIELEVTEEATIQNENKTYTRRNTKRTSEYNKTAVASAKTLSNMEALGIIGTFALAKLTFNYFLNPEPANDKTESIKDLSDPRVSSWINSHKKNNLPLKQPE